MEWENVLQWLCLRDPPGVGCLVRRDVARTLRTLVLLILFIYLFVYFFNFMYFQHNNYFSSSVSPSKVTLSPPFLCDSSVSTRSTISFSLSHPLLSVNLRISPLSPSLSCLRPCFSLSIHPSLFLPSIFSRFLARVQKPRHFAGQYHRNGRL